MKNPIIGRGVSSALFVAITEDGEYEVVRGTNGSGWLVQAVVEVISSKMLETAWVYIDYLLRSDYSNPGVSKARNLFEVPIRQAPISGFSSQVLSSPEMFFEENEPGLVVSPLAAINLGAHIEAIIVVRDRKTPVYSHDVMRSLRSFVNTENGETPILLPELVESMSKRIGASLDSGELEINGRKMYLSLGVKGGRTSQVRPKPTRSFTIKRRAKEGEKPPSTFPFWPQEVRE